MNNFREAVASAVSAVRILPPLGFSWFGKPFRPPRREAPLELPSHLRREYLLFSLQVQLYNDFYCKGGASANSAQESPLTGPGNFAFVQSLAAASAGSGYKESGWEVLAVIDSEVLVRKNGLTLRARQRDCITSADQILTPGLSVSLDLPGRLPHSSPGFYTVMGVRSTPQQTPSRLLRLYWNVSAEAAPALVRELTRLLNAADVSFRLKIVNEPARFVRCDAAVLYMDAAEYSPFVRTLEEAYAHVASMLKPMTPVFAKRLAPGLALAEDPGTGASFGMHRCRLVAEGILGAHERRVRGVEDRVRAVADCFRQEGLSIDRPYLNAGSPDEYTFVCSAAARTVSKAGEQRNPFPSEKRRVGQFIETAAGISARLAHQSIWYREQCNWIGSGPAPLSPNVASRTPIVITSSLGPDLYAGTSGVALYLAEFFRITSDRTAARLAAGAIRHALAHVESVPTATSPGLYTGWTGIALAAAHVGHVLGNEQLLQDATKLTGRILRLSLPEESDVLSGTAGTVMGLLLLGQALGDPNGRILRAAIRFGDHLLTAARTTRAGMSWKSTAIKRRRNLTGFSHGAAGIGCALLELYAATGERKYAKAAENALQYEQSWFDANACNWPDFRYPVTPGRRPASFATAWCHGAPGIALSRIRAYQVLGREAYLSQSEVALETTRHGLGTNILGLNGNFCLCHGFAGNADILLEGVVSSSKPIIETWHAAALQVAAIGQQHCSEHNNNWPCGAGGGETPGLMTGLAGIGYFYLRLHDHSTPSVLLLSTGFNRPALPPCSESEPTS